MHTVVEECNKGTSAHPSAEETEPPRPVHADARALFKRARFLHSVPIFGSSVEAYGPKCVLSVGFAEFIAKGVSDYLVRMSMFPMFTNRYGLDGMTYQRLNGVAMMGWSIKAFTAMFSDIFSLFGYTKRWYLAVSCLIGTVFALGYGLLPAQMSSAEPAAALVFLTCFTKANVDILTQGHYSRLMRRIPAAGPSLVSWVWGWVLLGSLVSASITGPLADLRLEVVGVFLAAGLQFMVTILFVFNWYGENTNRENRAEDARLLREKLLAEGKEAKAKQQEGVGNADGAADKDAGGHLVVHSSNSESCGAAYEEKDTQIFTCCCGAVEVNKMVARRNWKVVMYCILMTVGSISLAIVTILGDTHSRLYAATTISVFLCSFGFFALPLIIAKANLYMFLHHASYIHLPGALTSFFLAKPDCVPDGPHFSFFFYMTIGGIIGNLGGITGVTLFKYIFSKRSYRVTFIVTTTVQVVSSIFDLIIVERWNRPYISDHVMFVLGDLIVSEVCYMLSFMPGVILISRLCPHGTESMVYALLAGFSNFGQAVSNTIGSLLMEMVWPVRTKAADKDGCDFSNVKWLLLVGHFLTPLVCIPLVFLLIPGARICDNIDIYGKVIKPKEPSSGDGEKSSGDKEPVSK